MAARELNGYIIKDTRYEFEFNLRMIKGGETNVTRCYTIADSLKEAERLVRLVGQDIKVADGYDSVEVEAA